ncbi:hypothetical protein K488DRAFT_65668 [Vararia minispora EC-137]|uniref:Uncharacterized protein n=1 Tax=Vararia minispora EC-137 TaxID=1314806 RepID=A0ACB8Q4N6_9AGAM|nr:hypothetical protein K488DRAFT_65668 [Vararia minispora EC-137]
MPSLDSDHELDGHAADVIQAGKLTEISLHFPSDLPASIRCTIWPIVTELESDLHLTCMHSALSDVRHQLHLCLCLNRFKVKNVKGQRPNTCARVTQTAVDANIQATADCYIRHCEASLSLVGAGD